MRCGDIFAAETRQHPTTLHHMLRATPAAAQVLEVAEAGRGTYAAIPRSLDRGPAAGPKLDRHPLIIKIQSAPKQGNRKRPPA